jgi:hypothetical protein
MYVGYVPVSVARQLIAAACASSTQYATGSAVLLGFGAFG